MKGGYGEKKERVRESEREREKQYDSERWGQMQTDRMRKKKCKENDERKGWRERRKERREKRHTHIR